MVKKALGILVKDAVVSVGQLRTTNDEPIKSDPAAIPCVFSPDGALIAWSPGHRRVLILPWNTTDNCLDRDVVSARHDVSDGSCVSISAGVGVCTMAFGGAPGGAAGTRDPTARRRSWSRLLERMRGLIFATGHANGRIRLWDPYTGSLLLDLNDHRGSVRALQFAPDRSNRLVSVSTDKTIKAWDLDDDGNMYKTMCDCMVQLYRCCWKHDGSELLTCGRSKLVYILDMRKYVLRQTLKGHLHDVTSCSYSQDGTLVLSSSLDTTARIWDAYTGVALRTLRHLDPPPSMIFAAGANNAWVLDAALSGNCCQVVSVCEDQCLRVWDVWNMESSEPVTEPISWTVENETLTWCTINSTNNALALGTSLGNVTFYTLPRMVAPLKHLCRRAVRRATRTDHVNSLPVPHELQRYLRFEPVSSAY